MPFAPPRSEEEPIDEARHILFTIAGYIILAFAIGTCISTILFLRGALSADGVVTGDEFGNGTHISISFSERSGKAISFSQNGFIFGYGKGDKVRVLYHPDGEACLNSFGALWGVSLVLLVLASVFIILGSNRLKEWIGRELR